MMEKNDKMRGYGIFMEARKLSYKIKDEYGPELEEIAYKLKQLESGRVYDITGIPGDGYLATHVEKLRKQISSLLYKIETGKDGIEKEIAELFISK